MFRIQNGLLHVLLVHPGGPFWKKKDLGAWSIPKGEVEAEEDLLLTARREFKEEIGIEPNEPLYPLGSITQKSGKMVHAWAFEGDCDPTKICSNTTEIEWPPKSGKKLVIPEIDQAVFFTIREASEKINPAQLPLFAELEKLRPAEYAASSVAQKLGQASLF